MRKLFNVLRCLCRSYCVVPPGYSIPPDSLHIVQSRPPRIGGFADVWRGEYTQPDGRRVDVAIKHIRVNPWEASTIHPKVCQEIILWRRLSQHPRITPMIGIDRHLFPLCIVSKWMAHGDIMSFLRQSPDSNRLQLLIDVCEGLQHLHSQSVAHGDIKACNVVVDSKSRANLCDFGLSTLIHSVNSMNPSTQSNEKSPGTTLYMAPELMDPERYGLKYSHVSLEADVYALGLVMWEVFAGREPWGSLRGLYSNLKVARAVLEGQRPPRPPAAAGLPSHTADDVWDLIQRCWRQQWRERPRIEEVLRSLTEAAARQLP
ncbi:kinase-like protein [Daedalea quercina L-15889]|uniref:Kinase-like protein n=1 Tax=Daedalea quercina L-15889 TaxID=1314783 RepID=A0A165NFN5_9APHY|nr:kinase-like protein [Daedalea quercina L-15889]